MSTLAQARFRITLRSPDVRRALRILVVTGCAASLGSIVVGCGAMPTATPRASTPTQTSTTTGEFKQVGTFDTSAPTPPPGQSPPPPTLPPQSGLTNVTIPAYLCEPVAVPDTTFASGKHELVAIDPAMETAAANLAELRSLGVGATVSLVGHTDSVPSNGPGGNQGLSERRAQSIFDWMILQGIDPSWLTTPIGMADREPETFGTDAASLAKNRRVEITFNCPT
jgi:outer membrane protein OmpA-like peptidoglycan-associated protein